MAMLAWQAKNPWFGETALFADSRPRGATAFTLQQTLLLSVHMNKAKQLEEVPDLRRHLMSSKER